MIEQKVALPGGKGVEIKKIPGNLKFNDITLKRGIDKDVGLWKWRQLVVDGKFKDARCDGTIQMLDSEFNPVGHVQVRTRLGEQVHPRRDERWAGSVRRRGNHDLRRKLRAAIAPGR